MKSSLLLLATALIIAAGASAQSSLTYSLARPMAGGDLNLLETDVAASSATSIATYAAADLEDYDLGATTYDHQHGRFITLGSNLAGDVFVVGLNVQNGNIAYAYTSSAYELFSVEYYNDKAYSLARPIGGGDLTLLETDLSSGAETVIDTYSAADLDDYDSGSTTFDQQNGRFITLGSDQGGTVSVVGLNITNGNIDYAYASSTYELFSVEYNDGKAYSLARPVAGGDLQLLETNLSSGAETVIDTYPAAELDDYDPGATSFDHQNGRFVVLGSDLAGDVSVVTLNVQNGAMDHSYAPANYELFSIESGGSSSSPNSVQEANPTNALFHVSPNPTDQLLTLHHPPSYDQYEIINMLGIRVQVSQAGSKVIDVSSLPSGAYWVRVTGGIDTETRAFIKR